MEKFQMSATTPTVLNAIQSRTEATATAAIDPNTSNQLPYYLPEPLPPEFNCESWPLMEEQEQKQYYEIDIKMMWSQSDTSRPMTFTIVLGNTPNMLPNAALWKLAFNVQSMPKSRDRAKEANETSIPGRAFLWYDNPYWHCKLQNILDMDLNVRGPLYNLTESVTISSLSKINDSLIYRQSKTNSSLGHYIRVIEGETYRLKITFKGDRVIPQSILRPTIYVSNNAKEYDTTVLSEKLFNMRSTDVIEPPLTNVEICEMRDAPSLSKCKCTSKFIFILERDLKETMEFFEETEKDSFAKRSEFIKMQKEYALSRSSEKASLLKQALTDYESALMKYSKAVQEMNSAKKALVDAEILLNNKEITGDKKELASFKAMLRHTGVLPKIPTPSAAPNKIVGTVASATTAVHSGTAAVVSGTSAAVHNKTQIDMKGGSAGRPALATLPEVSAAPVLMSAASANAQAKSSAKAKDTAASHKNDEKAPPKPTPTK